METMYHIGLNGSHKAKYAILPGDPGRVEIIARYLDNSKKYCVNREYTTWIGELEGKPVIVMSTGIGGPSTAIAVEELYKTGVRTMIRIGTCGGMDKSVSEGDLIAVTGAIRMEGTTKEYMPIEFPAISNLDVTNALVQACKEKGYSWHAGIVHSKDSFYGQHDPMRMPVGYELSEKWQAWIKGHCLASEMECAALFIISQILGIRAGCILNTIGNQEKDGGVDGGHVNDPSRSIKVAVDAIRSLIIQETM